MPRYAVELVKTAGTTIIVEARNADEAKEIAERGDADALWDDDTFEVRWVYPAEELDDK